MALTPDEIDGLRELILAVYGPVTEELLRDWLFERRAAEVIFAVAEGREVGFALFFGNFSTFLGRGGIYLEDLFVKEQYRGIRPAPGYPACPDHTVKREMFRVLEAADVHMHLTESLAMMPAASVSGFYMAHPEATYFNVGKIGHDQVEDWALRMGLSVTDAERALAPLLS